MFEKKKKDGHKLSDNEKKAKSHVLENIRDLAHSAMSDKLKGLKKVSVAAPNQEGLQHGLDLAKHIVDKGMPEQSEEDGYAHGGRIEEEGGDVGNSTADELEEAQDDDLISRHGGGSKIVSADEEGENDDRDENEAQAEDSDEHDELDRQIKELMDRKASLDRK